MPTSLIRQTDSLRQTQSLASDFARQILHYTLGDTPAVIALQGSMGAGKTAFVQGFAKGLNITTPVTSPTFTILQHYQGIVPLNHYDAYRLSNAEEFYAIGGDEFFGQGLCIIEWPQNIAEALPSDTFYICIDPLTDTSRRITFFSDAWEQFLQQMEAAL